MLHPTLQTRNGERLSTLDRPSPTVGTNSNAFNQGNGRVRDKMNAALDVLDQPSATVSASGTAGGGGAEPFADADYRRKLGESLSRVDRPAPVIKESSGRAGRSARPSQRPAPELAAELEAAGLADRPSGNAVPPPLAAALGRSLAAALGR